MSETPKNPYHRVRRVGIISLLLLMLYVVSPMLYGAIQGVRTGDVWDPITGDRVTALQESDGCLVEAERLIGSSSSMSRLEGPWEEKRREWTVRCQSQHPDIWNMLNVTRTNLLKRSKSTTQE